MSGPARMGITIFPNKGKIKIENRLWGFFSFSSLFSRTSCEYTIFLMIRAIAIIHEENGEALLRLIALKPTCGSCNSSSNNCVIPGFVSQLEDVTKLPYSLLCSYLMTRCDCGPCETAKVVCLASKRLSFRTFLPPCLLNRVAAHFNMKHILELIFIFKLQAAPSPLCLACQSHTANSQSVTPTGGPDTSRPHVLPSFQIPKSTIHLQLRTPVTNHERQGDEILTGWYLHPRGW